MNLAAPGALPRRHFILLSTKARHGILLGLGKGMHGALPLGFLSSSNPDGQLPAKLSSQAGTVM
eukprot:483960-Pelagomonas_calceolata.AAC.2